MKSVKSKVITGIVTVGLLSGVGAAFATTDAATNLQNWYDGQFGLSEAKVSNTIGDYASSKVPALIKEYKGLRNDAAKSINDTKDTAITNSSLAINNAKKEHIDALTAQEAEIQKHIKSQFDGLAQDANTTIGLLGEEAKKYAQKDLQKFTTKQGNAALDQVNSDLTKASDDAVMELNAAIAQAKADLQTELDSQTIATIGRINDMINAKVWEVRKVIKDKKDELVTIQQGLITKAASDLEKSATEQLDAAVVGINN